MYTANQIADYFIAFSHEHGDPITNLKLQKLLYYAQAWHLALFDAPLFPDRIEAWVHGPVVPEVYRRFKGWAWKPIEEDPEYPTFQDNVSEFLGDLLREYGYKTAYELELLSHEEEPWRFARGRIPMDVESTAQISHASMAKYYKAQIDGEA